VILALNGIKLLRTWTISISIMLRSAKNSRMMENKILNENELNK